MHSFLELPPWENLMKTIVIKQIGNLDGLRILDFGSGQGILANYYAKNNQVTAIEPSVQMLKEAWNDYPYIQIIDDLHGLIELEDESFDFIICHNVLEYIDDQKEVIQQLSRVLKQNGKMSIVKHNRNGRIMQMAVLLDDFQKANDLLDGKNSSAKQFGEIRYYQDEDINKYCSQLVLEEKYGIRTFFDLQQNQEKHKQEDWQEKMIDLEMRVSKIEEFYQIAFFHHLLFIKQGE